MNKINYEEGNINLADDINDEYELPLPKGVLKDIPSPISSLGSTLPSSNEIEPDITKKGTIKRKYNPFLDEALIETSKDEDSPIDKKMPITLEEPPKYNPNRKIYKGSPNFALVKCVRNIKSVPNRILCKPDDTMAKKVSSIHSS